MKKVFLLVLSFFFFNVFSQTLETIKTLDTIYIYFDTGNYQKFENIGGSKDCSFDNFRYSFYLNQLEYIDCVFRKFSDFDNCHENGNRMDVKSKNKKFLKKFENRIIDINFLIKYGFKETFFAIIEMNSKVYIIDKKEIKCNKIKLREVILFSPFIEE